MSTKASKIAVLAIFINFILLLAIYWQTLSVYFLSEDYAWWPYVLGKNFWQFLRFVLPSSWQELTPSSWYRPLVGLSYWFNVNFCWMRPNCFHLTNLFFHFANYLLVVGVGYFFGKRNWFVGLLAGLLFTLFPFHAEAVVWIDGRNELIMTAFYLLSLLAYLIYQRGKKPIFLLLSLTSAFLSLLATEAAASLPLTILLVSIWKEQGTLWQRFKRAFIAAVPHFLLLFCYLALRYFAIGAINPWQFSHVQFTISRLFLKYLILLFVFLIAFVAVKSKRIFLSFMENKETDAVLVFLLLVGVFYLPMATLYTEERYLYLPSTALSWWGAYGFFLGKKQAKTKLAKLLVGLLIGLLVITCFVFQQRRNSYWHTAGLVAENTLWQIEQLTDNLPISSTLYFFNLPDNYQGVYVFRTHFQEAVEYFTGKDFSQIIVTPTVLGIGETSVEIKDNRTAILRAESGFSVFPPTIEKILPDGTKIIRNEYYQLAVEKGDKSASLELLKDTFGKKGVYFLEYRQGSVGILQWK